MPTTATDAATTPTDRLRRQLRAAIDARNVRRAELDELHADAENRGEDLTGERLEEHRRLVADLARMDEELDGLRADLEAMEARDAAGEGLADILPPEVRDTTGGGTPPAGDGVRSEPRTYHAGAEHGFFTDWYRAVNLGDQRAAQRLQRHDLEARVDGWHPDPQGETRDVGVSAFGALVVPQYLTELYAPNLQNGRPFLNFVARPPLPGDGMVLNIPRGTTATSVAVQAAEGNAVSETDFDETTLQVNVRTFAGQQDISRQALERGTNIDAIIYADLVEAYAAAVDVSAITDDGTSGTHLGVLNVAGTVSVTYDDASPTVAEFMPSVFDAVQQVQTGRKMGPTLIVMHPRRWGWLLAAVDGQNRPLVVPATGPDQGAQNAQGILQNFGYGGVVGYLAGLPVVTDANIPTNLGTGTNEDRVLVLRAGDVLFMEEAGAPRQARFDSPGASTLEVKLVVFGYSAFTAGRYPTGVAVIDGTGLVTPTF